MCNFELVSKKSILCNWKTRNIGSIVDINNKNVLKEINQKMELLKKENDNNNNNESNIILIQIISFELNKEKSLLTQTKYPIDKIELILNYTNQCLNKSEFYYFFSNKLPKLKQLIINDFEYLKYYFIKLYKDLKYKFLNKYFNVKLKNNNKYIRQLFKFRKCSRFKIFKLKLEKEMKEIFQYDILNITKNNIFKKMISIFIRNEKINEIVQNILRKNYKINSIKYILVCLFFGFEYFLNKSNFILNKTNYIKNEEITVYIKYLIGKKDYYLFIKNKNNSYHLCKEFLLASLNDDELEINNTKENLSDNFMKIILKITINIKRNYRDFLFLSSKLLDENFNDNYVLIRYGSILKINEIEKKCLENGKFITILNSRLLSNGGWDGVFEAIKEDKNYSIINLSGGYLNYNLSIEESFFIWNYAIEIIKLNNYLIKMNLSGCFLLDYSIKNQFIIRDLFEAINNNKNLRILDLSGINHGSFIKNPNIIINLANGIKSNQFLAELNLNNNELGCLYEKHANLLIDLLNSIKVNKSLKKINISSNKFILTSEIKTEINPLCDIILSNKIISDIDLSHNDLGKNVDIMEELAKAIKMNINLEIINLSYNFDSSSYSYKNNNNYIHKVFEAVELSQNLKEINLSGNKIGHYIRETPKIIKELCKALILNKKMIKLNLSNNNFHEPSTWKLLIDVIKNNKILQFIDLSSNFINLYIKQNEICFEELFETLKSNNNFKEINLSHNNLNRNEKILISREEVIKLNKNLNLKI